MSLFSPSEGSKCQKVYNRTSLPLVNMTIVRVNGQEEVDVADTLLRPSTQSLQSEEPINILITFYPPRLSGFRVFVEAKHAESVSFALDVFENPPRTVTIVKHLQCF